MPISIELSPELLDILFPFYMVIDNNLKILQIGNKLQKICTPSIIGAPFDQFFLIKKPQVTVNFNEIVTQIQYMFILEYLQDNILLKGQMIYYAEKQCLFFFGSPQATDLPTLKKLNLTIYDFALHDRIVDFIFLLESQNAALADAKKIATHLDQQRTQLATTNQELAHKTTRLKNQIIINKRHTKELKQLSDELEQRVEERTKELKLLSKDLEEKSIKLQEALALSASASRAKSVFVANMSHELRTPLNAIIGYSEMLAEETEEAGLSHYTADINKIISSAKHLLSLIRDVLDLSKIEAGKMEAFLGDVNIEVVVNDLKSIITPLIEKNNNVFQLHIGKIGTMHTDDMRLRQALLNLLSNASKFTKDGIISLDINPLLIDDKEWVQFSVTDTGIGMPADELEKLFQAFSQVDSSSTRKFGGTGLGLYLTRLFCEMLGGEITAESTYGKGSTFTITLPLKSEEMIPKNYLLGQPVNISTTTPLSVKSVLIIDDDINIHKEIENNLKTSNYTVLHAFNGVEGLNLIRMNKPNVIVLDIIMPVMDGWSMLTALKAEPSLAEIPVILMCLNSEEGLGFALGIADYVYKPVDIKQLIEKIKYIISDTEANSILIVDDDAYARDIMQRAVQKAGKKSIAVTNGKEAIEYLQQHIPPLILLDLLMPEMDGFTVMHLMQQNENWRTIPIIVITGKTLSKEEYNMLAKFKKIVLQKDSYPQKKLVSVICEQILRIAGN